MTDASRDAVIENIRELVDAPHEGDSAPSLAHIEATLTDGYAVLLQLEAERLRLEKQIGAMAADLADGDFAGKATQIAVLSRRLSSADGDLTRLRDLLRTLRVRHAAVRAAA
jgi:hypothetical protein